MTPLGKECRRLRKERQLMLADQAKALSVSVSYLSAVETGKKPASPEFVERFASWLELNEEEKRQLRKCADATARVVRLVPLTVEQARLASAMARYIADLTAEGAEKVTATLHEERQKFQAAPTSCRAALAPNSSKLRTQFG